MSGTEKESARVSVRILEKEFLVACPMEERSALLDSAEYLNQRMREIRDSGKVVGYDRIAVIAALNLANDLLRLQAKEQRSETEAASKLRVMRERIGTALERDRQLEL
jgi:cell division protein ZapA